MGYVDFKRNFDYLHNKLQTKLTRDATLCAVIGGHSLWRLGTDIEVRTISYLFGVGISAACNIVHEVCAAIVDTFMD